MFPLLQSGMCFIPVKSSACVKLIIHRRGTFYECTVLVLMFLPEAGWNKTGDFHVVSACEFVSITASTVVAPLCFHFTITALTITRGRSSRAEISWSDLWQTLRNNYNSNPTFKGYWTAQTSYTKPKSSSLLYNRRTSTQSPANLQNRAFFYVPCIIC